MENKSLFDRLTNSTGTMVILIAIGFLIVIGQIWSTNSKIDQLEASLASLASTNSQIVEELKANNPDTEANNTAIEDNKSLIVANHSAIKDNESAIEDSYSELSSLLFDQLSMLSEQLSKNDQMLLEALSDSHEIVRDNSFINKENHEIVRDNSFINKENYDINKENYDKLKEIEDFLEKLTAQIATIIENQQ